MKYNLFFFGTMVLVLSIIAGCSYSQNNQSFDDLRKDNICDYSIKKLIKLDSKLNQLNEFMVKRKHIKIDSDFNLFMLNIKSSMCFDFSRDYGIYIFGEMSSHPILYLWFVNRDGTSEIIDSKTTTEVLKELSNFYMKNEVTDDTEQIMLLYGVTKYLNQENDYPIPKENINYSWQKND